MPRSARYEPASSGEVSAGHRKRKQVDTHRNQHELYNKNLTTFVVRFCVRDGNRWTLIAINTNYIGKSIYALTFFLVTRTGFEPMLTA